MDGGFERHRGAGEVIKSNICFVLFMCELVLGAERNKGVWIILYINSVHKTAESMKDPVGLASMPIDIQEIKTEVWTLNDGEQTV